MFYPMIYSPAQNMDDYDRPDYYRLEYEERHLQDHSDTHVLDFGGCNDE